MDSIITAWNRVTAALDTAGAWAALVPIRLLMGYEFGKAGFTKLHGKNWFGNVQENFLFPFNLVPVDVSWFLATWVEILGGIGLALGLATRFWAFSLIILSINAIAAVHWPAEWNSLSELWQGYSVSDKGFGNFRIPLLFVAMLVPLVFLGGGKASLDRVLAHAANR